MAVLKVFSTTNSTKAAVWTVIRLLVISHPQVTNTTMVFSKFDATGRVNTLVSIDDSKCMRFKNCETT